MATSAAQTWRRWVKALGERLAAIIEPRPQPQPVPVRVPARANPDSGRRGR